MIVLSLICFPLSLSPRHLPLQVEFIKDHMGNLITTKPVIYLVNMGAPDFQRCSSHLLSFLDFLVGVLIVSSSPDGHCPCIYLSLRKKNKWLPKIHQWVQEHGGGNMIPFSVEWEQKLWNLRDDPDGQKAFLDTEPKSVSALSKMIVQGYKELVCVATISLSCFVKIATPFLDPFPQRN